MSDTPQYPYQDPNSQGGYGQQMPNQQGGYGQPAYGASVPQQYQPAVAQGYPPAGYGQPGPAGHPVQLFIAYPQRSSRALAGFSIPFFLARYIMLIPAFFCLYFVSIAAAIVAWIACWAVLFTGRYPAGMHGFVTGVMRWNTRTSAYLYGLTDAYPPFRFEP